MNSLPVKTIVLILLLATVSTTSADDTTGAGRRAVGRTVADFTLSDYRGKATSLKDFHDARVIVVVIPRRPSVGEIRRGMK